MKLFTILSDKKFFKENIDSSNSFIFYVAISFFILIPVAFVGAFNNVSFLISFAFSGLFFTLYEMFNKKNSLLFLGISFSITTPQILQLEIIHVFLKEKIMELNDFFSLEISSSSISNALTIASLGLVLFSLSKNNQKIEEISVENKRLTDTVNQQEDWKIKFDQINQLDEIDEQIIVLTDIIDNEKDSLVLSRAYAMRGNVYRKNNMPHKALEDFGKSIILNPNNPITFAYRGLVFSDMGNLEEAIRDVTKAIKLDPDFALAYNSRGIAFKNMGNLEEAIGDFTKAIELKPDYAFAYNNRGAVFNSKGNQEKAIRDFTKAIELNSDYAEPYYNRGIAFKHMGNLEEAIRDYT
ncbi:tetratricopeptide repeat protein, partial [Bacillus sp. SRB1LM]|uniref:tetratricopeptide repeat protein n=1 Tax=Bacillus sp. SRB1LM TaxID=2608688 RepID=UPI0018C3A8E0